MLTRKPASLSAIRQELFIFLAFANEAPSPKFFIHGHCLGFDNVLTYCLFHLDFNIKGQLDF